jgi:hypothetical protein
VLLQLQVWLLAMHGTRCMVHGTWYTVHGTQYTVHMAISLLTADTGQGPPGQHSVLNINYAVQPALQLII